MSEKTGMRAGFRQRIDDALAQGNAQARMDFLRKLMDSEGCTYEEAVDMCIGENRNPRYSLYYRMADIEVVQGLMTKKGKLRFAETLPDDEKEIYLAEMGEVKVGREIAKGIAKAPADQVRAIRRTMKKNRELRRQAKKVASESLEDDDE